MRAVTWNIQHLAVYLEVETPAEDHFARAVRALDPDVLLLQEVDEFNPRSGSISQLEIAAHAMGASDYRFIATPAAPGDYGIAIASRLPVVHWAELRLPRSPIGQRLTFIEDGRPNRYYVADHGRAALAAVLDNGWTVVNTHCSFVPGMAQLHLLRAWRWGQQVARSHSTRLLFGGDLNQSGVNWLRNFGASTVDGAPTFPSWQPERRIDHFLVERGQRGLETVKVADRSEISDHLPVEVLL